MNDWVITIISGAIGAIIGTFGGVFLLDYWQNRKNREIRDTAIKALRIFLTIIKSLLQKRRVSSIH